MDFTGQEDGENATARGTDRPRVFAGILTGEGTPTSRAGKNEYRILLESNHCRRC